MLYYKKAVQYSLLLLWGQNFMKYIDYQERAQQGTFNFPIAFYHQTPHSPRYDMQ
ncbi:AraC family transcriptional regulator, partial [Soehngenia saccharolytica]